MYPLLVFSSPGGFSSSYLIMFELELQRVFSLFIAQSLL